MTPTVLVVVMLGVTIAYANGANDVSKGIATLAGSGVTDYRRAILWGTFWTGVGGLLGAFLADAMVTTFGKGLFAAGIAPSIAAALATIAGAVLWVAIATWAALPVSTTHAIVGSLAGVGAVAYGLAGVNWIVLLDKIAVPLLLSPVVALAITAVALRSWRTLAPSAPDCLCAELEPMAIATPISADGTAAVSLVPGIRFIADSQRTCEQQGATLRLTVNHLHWMTSGATALARGLNDAPKMVALLLAAAALSGMGAGFRPAAFAAVTLGMVGGSWIAGRRVTEVLAEKVTRMDHREGFIANLVTAALVAPGAALGLPMSTTHVSSGAIIGVGVQNRLGVNWTTVREMLMAWIVTLPGAALLGIAVYGCIRLLGVR